MAGNTLGQRRYYEYTSDTGAKYTYLTDKDLGDAVSATESTANPPMPRRFKPRGVYAQAEINDNLVRKFVICPSKTTAAYNKSVSSDITIDGETFKTTGRRGETMSFASNPAGGSGGGGGGAGGGAGGGGGGTPE